MRSVYLGQQRAPAPSAREEEDLSCDEELLPTGGAACSPFPGHLCSLLAVQLLLLLRCGLAAAMAAVDEGPPPFL